MEVTLFFKSSNNNYFSCIFWIMFLILQTYRTRKRKIQVSNTWLSKFQCWFRKTNTVIYYLGLGGTFYVSFTNSVILFFMIVFFQFTIHLYLPENYRYHRIKFLKIRLQNSEDFNIHIFVLLLLLLITWMHIVSTNKS